VYVAAADPVQERVELCEEPRVMLDGDRLHVNPVRGEIVIVSVMVPAYPFDGAIVTLDVAALPASASMTVGLVDTVKSLIA
jgi:hypothetical protein